MVVIHGGFWRQEYGLELGRPIASDLVRHGVAVWNIEYRRLGGGGGWPQTGHDVFAAIDALVALDHPLLDLSRIVTLGHSAGGHLAVWVAARHDRVTGAVAQAGVLDFRAHPQITRRAAELLGGLPDEVPERYADASPAELLPIGVPVICVHGDEDVDVPFEQSESFQGATEVVRVPGAGHMDVITPGTEAWEACRDAALRLVTSGRMPADCLFCRIIAGEIPSTAVHETDTTLAFRDIAPQAPTHVVLVPKRHEPNAVALAAAAPNLLNDLFAAAGEVAKSEGIADTGYRLLFNTGPEAGQTVFHVHLHLLGGKVLGALA